jgi:putative ABC transport system permease protein
MLLAAIRDLQYRRRRVLVAVAGASLVLGLGLVMSGLAASFGNEADRTFAVLGADRWAVPPSMSGPFAGFSPMPADEALAMVQGGEAGGVLASRVNAGTAEDPLDGILIGVEPGQPGSPLVTEAGTTLGGDGEAVVSSRFGFSVGQELSLGQSTFEIVGLVDASMLAGSPVIIVTLADAQLLATNGRPVVTSLALDADAEVVGELRVLDAAAARDDAVRPLESAEQTIAFVRTLLWLVAAMIVGSVLYLNALERTGDVAVFKAIGVSGRSVVMGMFLQALIVGVAASAAAAVIGLALAPVFPLRVEIPNSALTTLPVVALVVSCLGALAGVRRAVKISPALAFGGV